MSTWSYDGAITVSVSTIFADAEQAAELILEIDDGNDTFVTASGAVGDPVTLTATGIGGLSAGDLFVANLTYVTSFFDTDFGAYTRQVTKEARLFTFGTPGAGVAFAPSVSFSGTTVSWTVELDFECSSAGSGIFVGGTDCNSTSVIEPNPGAQGSLFSGSITNVGHCDASPFGPGESFEFGMNRLVTFTPIFLIKLPVVAPAFAVDFSGTPRSGAAPLMVCFTDLTTGVPTSWSWDFGDGGTSTLQNPCHLYAAPGTYTVALTASDGTNTSTETKIGYITVGAFAQIHLASKGGIRAAST